MKIKRILIPALVLLTSFSWAAGQQEQGTTIRVAHFYDSMGDENHQICVKWLEGIKSDFEAANPDISVEYEQLKWDEIDVKMMSDHRAGISEHDLTLSSPQMMPQHALVGDLADLTPFIERDWDAAELSEFSWASSWEKMKQNGKHLGIPFGNHSRLLIYNKTMFEEAGLDMDKPPRTIDELISMAKKLTLDKDGDGEIDQYGLGIALGADRATIEASFAPLIWGFGGELWDPDTKEAVFADDNGVKTAELLYEMVNESGVVSPAAVVKDYSRNIFDSVLQEEVAMALGWGSYWTGVLEELGYVEGIFPPTVEGEMTKVGVFPYPTSVQAGFVNCWALSMYERSENKEAAWKFMNFIMQPQYLRNYPDAGLPIRKSEWELPEYGTQFYKEFYASIEKGRPMPSTAHYGELADTVYAALQEIMNGEKSDIPAILKDAEDRYNASYKGE